MAEWWSCIFLTLTEYIKLLLVWDDILYNNVLLYHYIVLSPWCYMHSWLTWLLPLLLALVMEHRPPTSCIHCAWSWIVVSIVPHMRCASFIPCSTPLLYVLLDLPLLCPCGFHWRTVLVIVLLGFLNICPIHVHILLFCKISADSCFVSFHKFSFLYAIYYIL